MKPLRPIILCLLCVCLSTCIKPTMRSYDLKVRIDPLHSRIDSEVSIKHPPSNIFYLNNALVIHRVLVDGVEVPYHWDISKHLPYSEGSAVVVDVEQNPIGELQVEYGGVLKGVMNDVNMISTDLIELALYACWYPQFEDIRYFDFKLEIDLPSKYVVATNGLWKGEINVDGRRSTKWASFKPSFDIVVLSSPHFEKIGEELNGINSEIYFNKMPPKVVSEKNDILLSALKQLSLYYGPQRTGKALRLVYSPRSGWGYSRIPLFVVSEEHALGLLRKPFGQARDFHDLAHELSHFWWMIADPNTQEDWLNEGLAEFSAFRLSESFFGKDFAELLIKEYQKHSLQTGTGESIVDTDGSSGNRYVNRYEKPTLLFIKARRRYGVKKLDDVLKVLHSKFADTRTATTIAFLNEIEKQLGSNAKEFFIKELYRKNVQ